MAAADVVVHGIYGPETASPQQAGHQVVIAFVKDQLNLDGVIALPDSIWPLYNNGEREEILAGLPSCDQWGIIPEGPINIDRPNPFAWQVGATGSSSDDAGDKEKEDSADDVVRFSSAMPGLGASPPGGGKQGPPTVVGQATAGGSRWRRQRVIIGLNE